MWYFALRGLRQESIFYPSYFQLRIKLKYKFIGKILKSWKFWSKINRKHFYSWFEINYEFSKNLRNPLPAYTALSKHEKNQHRSTVDFK